MREIYHVYCDESCHIENDGQLAMVLGAVWCPAEARAKIFRVLRTIKKAYGLDPQFEVKWTKVSPGAERFYSAWLEYFLEEDDLHFRALVVPDKSKLRHEAFDGQDHDTWYYKMYFDLLKVIFRPDSRYRVFIDLKDTLGETKVKKLHDVLCNNMYDFSREVIANVQQVRSHEVELVQLADFLAGIVSYANRGLTGSPAKLRLVEQLKRGSGYSLTATTLLKEEKVNLLNWRATETD